MSSREFTYGGSSVVAHPMPSQRIGLYGDLLCRIRLDAITSLITRPAHKIGLLTGGWSGENVDRNIRHAIG